MARNDADSNNHEERSSPRRNSSSASPLPGSCSSATEEDALLAHTSREDDRDRLDGGLSARSHEGEDNERPSIPNHEPSVQKSFSFFAALGLGFSITNSWVGYLSCFGQNLKYGGPQIVIFGLLIATIIQWTITLGLSEIASAFPSSGGQYHFVYILAPQRTRQFAAFVVGWMNLLAWSVTLCSGVSVFVAAISGIASFSNIPFGATQGQQYLIYLFTAVTSVSPLFLGPKWVSRILQANLILSITGFAVTFGIVVVMRQYTQPGSFITNPNSGTSGWGPGVAWMMGIGNAMYAYGGTDAAIHIAEEMRDPERELPRVMNMTIAIGFMTAFPLLLAMMLSMDEDISATLTSQLPMIEVFYEVTKSRPITLLIMTWVSVVLYSALLGQWVTCGRLAWAFARDRGLPYSSYFSHVNERHGFPVRTTLLSLCFCASYGLLYLISTTAFNSIVTSAVLYLNITYAIPQALVAIRGRKNVLPARALDLGRFGYLCNFLSPILVTVIGIFICFPPELPVTRYNANWSPLVLVTLLAMIVGMWFTIGRRFEGPNIDWDALQRAKTA